jgi:dTDP-glucose 4,6-dehydratase
LAGQIDSDLEELLEICADDFRSFQSQRLFITGGTGFFGTWLLRAIVYANERLGTNIQADVLSRDPEAFKLREPTIASHSRLRFVRGQITDSRLEGAYDGVVHAATEASASLNDTRPDVMLQTIVDGTRNLIGTIIESSGAIPVLFTSSGAVYGRQPVRLERVPETYAGAPDPLDAKSAYHEGKRIAELQLTIAAARGCGLPKIARLFAFLGPGLPLDAHFAAGNFLRDAALGRRIEVRNGSPFRSYLYPTDMIAWCLAIFARGATCRAYNVGSPEAVTIADLARRIGESVEPPVGFLRHDAPAAGTLAERYVPDTSRICSELGTQITVSLQEAISRTIRYLNAS